MGTIALEGMEFFAYHGCFKEEQIIGNIFIVDVYITTNTSEAEISDNLIHTINYQNVYSVIKTEMEKKSHLLEHIARRILIILYEKFSTVQHIKIKLSKINPPLGGKMNNVSFILEK